VHRRALPLASILLAAACAQGVPKASLDVVRHLDPSGRFECDLPRAWERDEFFKSPALSVRPPWPPGGEAPEVQDRPSLFIRFKEGRTPDSFVEDMTEIQEDVRWGGRKAVQLQGLRGLSFWREVPPRRGIHGPPPAPSREEFLLLQDGEDLIVLSWTLPRTAHWKKRRGEIEGYFQRLVESFRLKR